MKTLSYLDNIDQAKASSRKFNLLHERETKALKGKTPPSCGHRRNSLNDYFDEAWHLMYKERFKRNLRGGGNGRHIYLPRVYPFKAQHLLSHGLLQGWDPATRKLWFQCNDLYRFFLVSSQKELVGDWLGFKVASRLSPDLVETFLSGAENVNGERLLTRFRALLEQSLHSGDSRLYLFLSLWLTGTYLYSLFGHYGYLFFYSRKNRSERPHTQEVVSHLTYEGIGPLNAPTPAVMRELTYTGVTIPPEAQERWKGKKPDSFSFAMEILGAGFWEAREAVREVPHNAGDWQRQEYLVFAPYAFAGINPKCSGDLALECPFPLGMKHGSTGELRGRRYNPCMSEAEFKPVRDDLYIWALQNAEMVSLFYSLNPFEREIAKLSLSDQAVHIWKPLFTVLFVLGFDPESVEWSDLSSLAVEMHHIPKSPLKLRPDTPPRP